MRKQSLLIFYSIKVQRIVYEIPNFHSFESTNKSASKIKTLNLSVKIEKFTKQFPQIQTIFWSETYLITTVTIAILAKFKAAKN